MYSSSGANSGYFSTNGQTSHGYIEPFYPNDGIESSPNEALVPHVTSPSSPKAKNKKKSGKCSCCQWDLASRSGHSLLAILANFVTVVIAIVCLVVVVNVLVEQKVVDEFVEVLALYSLCLWTTACILVLTIIFALFGIYADLTERKIPLKVFLVFVALVVIGFLFTATVSLVTRSQLKQSVHESFNRTLTNSYGSNEDITKALDILHQRSQCCGTAHYTDWRYSSWLKQQTEMGVVVTLETNVDAFGGQPTGTTAVIFAPDSCCKTVLANCGYLLHPNNLYETGCAQTIHEVYDRNLIKFAIIGFVLAFFELLAFVSSLYLLNRVLKQLVWQWY